MGLNLIELYYEAADRLVAQFGFDITYARNEYAVLKRAYGGSTPVSYADPVRRYVYMKAMAPRHAIVWREFVRTQVVCKTPGTSLQLNSIGAGPAPEVLGFLEGYVGTPTLSRIDVRCLESEPQWRPAGEIVAELYRLRSGKDLTLTYVDTAAQLHQGAYTLGSMVLSDLARAGAPVHTLLSDVRQQVAPCKGLFLDAVKCRTPDGQDTFTSKYVDGSYLVGRWIGFSDDGDKYANIVRAAVSDEVAAMSRGLELDLTTGFVLNGYHMRFSNPTP